MWAPHGVCFLTQVDPVIRASMDIDLAGSVIIFDEGHNIEDTARWACSSMHHGTAQTPCARNSNSITVQARQSAASGFRMLTSQQGGGVT